jgi:hypothetical protein
VAAATRGLPSFQAVVAEEVAAVEAASSLSAYATPRSWKRTTPLSASRPRMRGRRPH